MSLKSYRKVSLNVLLFVVFLSIAPFAYAQIGVEEEQPLDPAIAQIEAAGEYSFIAQVEQTLIPRPNPENVGTTEQYIDSQMTGKVVLPDYAQINLQFESGSDLPPITIEQEGENIFLIEDGERTQIENPLSLSPTTDFLGYMKAAKNVRTVENGEQPHLTVYQFDIDGVAYGEYLIKTTQEALPSGQTLAHTDLPDVFHNMSGSGELWVDADGYPQRQVLDIHIPEANDQFDAQSRIVIDYQYETELSGLVLPTADNLSGSDPSPAGIEAGLPLPISPPELAVGVTYTLLSILFLSLVIVLVATSFSYSAYRWLKVAGPIALVVIMVATPILQPIAAVYGATQNGSIELPSLAEALGMPDQDMEAEESPDLEKEDIGEIEARPAALQAQISNNNNSKITCGTGNTSTDTDADGTTDFVENCLGTNPFSIDTDFDGITDTIEINGFVFTDTQNITHTIYTNPQELDSNNDGLTDLDEMPFPLGRADSHDPDGDNIPNVWDSDNDGDGVEDDVDLDPFTKTAFQPDFSIQTGLNGSSFTGTQYIEFHVQPQDQSRFQLMTTELDWPYDDQGTLQARDVSRNDELTFAPMLKVETNLIPGGFRREYGITSQRQGGKDYMYIDLAPVSANGRINAFYGKVAYSSFELQDINWSKVEMVWVALMKHTPLNEADSSKYSTIPVAEYTEPSFRFTGLEVSKSNEAKYAVIGTPNAQTDHRQLVNLLAGLEGSFLNAVSPDFDTVISRLTDPTSSITDTWGVPVSDIAVGVPLDQPSHIDQAFFRFWSAASTTTQFLTSNGYSTSDYASTIFAMESSLGVDGLDGEAVINGKTITFNLAKIPVYKSRSVNLSHYEYTGGAWATANDVDVLNNLVANYPGDPAAAVTTLKQAYPNIEEGDLAAMFLAFYLLWGNGRSAIVSVDGITILQPTEDAATLYQRIGLTSITDLLVYMVEAYKLGDPTGSVVYRDLQTYDQFSSAFRDNDAYFISGIALLSLELTYRIPNLVGLTNNTFRVGFRNIRVDSANLVRTSKLLFGYDKPIKDAGFAVGRYRGNSIQVRFARSRYVPKNGLFGRKFMKITKKIAKFPKTLARLGRGIAIIGAGVTIGMAWASYSKFSSPYGYERTYAALYASVETVTALFYLAIGFTGVGSALVLALLILDIIGWLASSAAGEPVDSIVTTTITKLILDLDPYTKLDNLDYVGLYTRIGGKGYPVAGNTITLG
ncbi:MAG: hypothetical protein AAF633_13860, partial [Chloroflexota bacterium]